MESPRAFGLAAGVATLSLQLTLIGLLSKLKVLGVFIGIGDLIEDNWRPRINAVNKVLSSSRSRSLSFRGKALVINALSLLRIWYVASLFFMAPRIMHELVSLVFNFFWSGKRDLVSRSVVVQSSLFGGFSVVDVKLKVWPPLAQWVKRFASSRSGWVSFMSYWFWLSFDASPTEVFSAPSSFRLGDLPPPPPPSISPWLRPGVNWVELFQSLDLLWFLDLWIPFFVFLCVP